MASDPRGIRPGCRGRSGDHQPGFDFRGRVGRQIRPQADTGGQHVARRPGDGGRRPFEFASLVCAGQDYRGTGDRRHDAQRHQPYRRICAEEIQFQHHTGRGHLHADRRDNGGLSRRAGGIRRQLAGLVHDLRCRQRHCGARINGARPGIRAVSFSRPSRRIEFHKVMRRLGVRDAAQASFTDSAPHSGVASPIFLLKSEYRWNTLAICASFIFITIIIYMLYSWLPAGLSAQGLRPRSVGQDMVAFNVGGIGGAALSVALIGRFSTRLLLILSGTLGTGVALALMVFPPVANGALWYGAMGALLFCAHMNFVFSAVIAIAVQLFPPSLRATGMGLAYGSGKTGRRRGGRRRQCRSQFRRAKRTLRHLCAPSRSGLYLRAVHSYTIANWSRRRIGVGSFGAVAQRTTVTAEQRPGCLGNEAASLKHRFACLLRIGAPLYSAQGDHDLSRPAR